jgi:hypothetical protein
MPSSQSQPTINPNLPLVFYVADDQGRRQILARAKAKEKPMTATVLAT